jgi:hypothetical protein
MRIGGSISKTLETWIDPRGDLYPVSSSAKPGELELCVDAFNQAASGGAFIPSQNKTSSSTKYNTYGQAQKAGNRARNNLRNQNTDAALAPVSVIIYAHAIAKSLIQAPQATDEKWLLVGKDARGDIVTRRLGTVGSFGGGIKKSYFHGEIVALIHLHPKGVGHLTGPGDDNVFSAKGIPNIVIGLKGPNQTRISIIEMGRLTKGCPIKYRDYTGNTPGPWKRH